VACSEIALVCFTGPNRRNLISHALFGDGVNVGPFTAGECPVFEMVAAMQTTIPKTQYALGMCNTMCYSFANHLLITFISSLTMNQILG
jgi:hypothetical protein